PSILTSRKSSGASSSSDCMRWAHCGTSKRSARRAWCGCRADKSEPCSPWCAFDRSVTREAISGEERVDACRIEGDAFDAVHPQCHDGTGHPVQTLEQGAHHDRLERVDRPD